MDVAYALDIEKYFTATYGRQKDVLNEFIIAVKDNCPVFMAARFFVINRKTVFNMFNAIITFLIVMVQFETNYLSYKENEQCSSAKCNLTMESK